MSGSGEVGGREESIACTLALHRWEHVDDDALDVEAVRWRLLPGDDGPIDVSRRAIPAAPPARPTPAERVRPRGAQATTTAGL